MHRKALVGVAATAFSVAALYGVSAKPDGATSSPSNGTTLSFNVNNSSSNVALQPSEDANSLYGLSRMMASKPPQLLPLPSAPWDSDWDHRNGSPASLKGSASAGDAVTQCSNTATSPESPTATRNLFLIRHGQYHTEETLEANRKLTVLGREQLELTGCRLRELGIRFDRLVASTMTRAQESASIVHCQFPELCVENEPLLEEGVPIKPQPPIESWTPTDEQFREDGKRIEAAFRKYFHRASPDVKEDTNEIVVCHGNVIRYCVCRALQVIVSCGFDR